MAQQDSEERGKVDGIALLYIAGGIPAMIVFFIVLFTVTRYCGIPV